MNKMSKRNKNYKRTKQKFWNTIIDMKTLPEEFHRFEQSNENQKLENRKICNYPVWGAER